MRHRKSQCQAAEKQIYPPGNIVMACTVMAYVVGLCSYGRETYLPAGQYSNIVMAHVVMAEKQIYLPGQRWPDPVSFPVVTYQI